MKRFVTTVTQRGQVTLPAEVRRVLGVGPREKVAFTVDGEEVRLMPASFTLESAYGSVEPLSSPQDLEELSRIAKQERAERVGRELQAE